MDSPLFLYLRMTELSKAHGLSNFDTAASKQDAKFGRHSSVCFNAITFPIEAREILGVITFGITTSCAWQHSKNESQAVI